MIAAAVLLSCSLAAQTAPQPDAARLVEQLGSFKFSEREAATRTLETLGATAIPHLMAGRESKDLEIRTRSAAILRRVQGSLLTQPTMLQADFEDVALSDLVRVLGERTGMSIALNPENLPRWRTERVTLREGEPIPFWQFMDRLCAAANLHAELEARGSMARGGTALKLSQRGGQPVYPTMDHGPFRVRLIDLEFRHNLDFSPPFPPAGRNPRDNKDRPSEPPRPQPVARIVGSSKFQVMAEPRLSLSHNGAFVLLEARDDRGNSLIPENRSPATQTRAMGYMGASCTSILHLQAILQRPENPGRMIKILRGNVPMMVAARQPDPLVVSLAGAAGRSFDKGAVRLTVHALRSEPNSKRQQVEITIQGKRGDSPGGGGEPPIGDSVVRVESLQRQLEIVDERGRLLPWFQSSVDAGAGRLTLTLNGLGAAEPRELRYFELTETTVQLPFTFTDIPLP